MLSDLDFATSYNKAESNIAEEFYLPCMRNSCEYDRVSGYFGSTIYIIAWNALKEFMDHHGRMRIICSPYISAEDEAALTQGYAAKKDEILANAIVSEMEGMLQDAELAAPSRLLAYLVVQGIIDVKLAVPTGNETASTRRLFHDKVGIFKDTDGNMVGFRGSMNETFKGLSDDGNIESIDVFPGWVDKRDRDRALNAENFFSRLWNGSVDGVQVYEFPEAAREVLKVKTNGRSWQELWDEIDVPENKAKKWRPGNGMDSRLPREHQVDALEAWVKNGRRGIFEHATGSGKTFTAICAINDALKKNEVVLVLVPSRDLLHQWVRELRETLTGSEVRFLLCGDGNTEWRRQGTLTAWSSGSTHSSRIILATMDTACSEEFRQKLSKGTHLMIVADEVHRMGSPRRRNILKIDSGARLGLSATPRRYGDPEGTKALFDYFGGLIPPPFTLEDAIRRGVLTRYFYYPQRISLTESEQEEWNALSVEINKLIAGMPDRGEKLSLDSNPRLKKLLIQRSRIVKNAEGKVALAVNLLKTEFKNGQKWIVYCDNQKQLHAVCDGVRKEGLDAYEYYADMEGSRDTTLKYFSLHGGILISIKCLDEGVDIPSSTHALILASSQNPREFIQRRGRILRKSPGKYFAYLYDAITVPVLHEEEEEQGLSIISAELARAIEFGNGAENPACIADLKNIAIDFHIDYDTIKEGGMEDDFEQN